MISILSGFFVAAGGAGGLWYFMPTDGKIHRLVTSPVFNWTIPIAITSALAIGAALIIAGFSELGSP
jgi:hypothetical protein